MIHSYMKKLGILASAAILSCFAASESFAQAPLVKYSFTGAAGNEDSLAADSPQPANATFYAARRGPGVMATAGANYITGNNWSAAFDPTDYFSFGGRPNAGYELDLTSVALTVRHSSSGPQTAEIRSSLDNYTTVLKTITLPTTVTTNIRDSVVLPAAFMNQTSKVEFRVFGYGGTATTGTFRLDDIKIYGSVSATSGSTNPIIAFASGGSTVAENVGAVTVTVQIANQSTTSPTSVNVNLGTGTATSGSDFTFTGTTLTWAAGDNSPKTVTINVTDDVAVESNETVILTLSNATNGAILGAASYTLTITDNDAPAPAVPLITIANATTNDPVTFIPTKLNQKVSLRGIVYGGNNRTTGYQVTLIDNTGGIGLFKNPITLPAPGWPATFPVEGDSIQVWGKIEQFNGLTQVNLDSVRLLMTNQTLKQPMMVTGPLTEVHESELVKIANPVTIVNPAQWTNTGSGFTVQVTDGTNTYDMRILNTTNIYGTPAPTSPFFLTGIGGQFDNSNPYDGGYQLIPRRLSDIVQFSAPLVKYTFTGAAGNEDSLAADSPQPANATFYAARRGSGVTASSGAGYIAGSNWSTAFDANDYFSFSGRANPGYKLNLTSLALSVRHSSSGPQTAEIRSSLDNYTTVLKTITLPSTVTTNIRDSVALPAAFQNLTSKVEFRVFGYGGTAATGTFRMDDVKLYGNVAVATTAPLVSFATSGSTVAENAGTVNVSLTITNPTPGAATSVTVGVSGGTATATSDYTFTGSSTGSTVTWAAGDSSPKTVTITVVDNTVAESTETVILSLTNPTNGATIGTGTYTLTITDNDAPAASIPTYTVAQITTNNAVTFLPDSIGVKVKVIGVLYGINQRTAGGLQITLRDATGGVGLFKSTNAGLPATLPMEGDSVRAIGTVGHFNGLTQISLDSLVVLGTNRPLRNPIIVNGPLTEAHESELVKIANPVTLVNPAQWTNTGSGFTAQVTDGTNTYDLRIVAASNIFGTPAPTGAFFLTGIGGQFDNSDPRDSGYQIIPRRLSDIQLVSAVSENLSSAISVYPNPVSAKLHLDFTAIAAKGAKISVLNALGQVVTTIPANATELNVASYPAGVYTIQVISNKAVAVKRFVKVN